MIAQVQDIRHVTGHAERGNSMFIREIIENISDGSLTAQQMLNKLSKEMQGTHTGAMDPNSDWSKFVLSHKGFTLKDIQVDQIPTAVKSDGMSQDNIEKYKQADTSQFPPMVIGLSLIHISEPTRQAEISYAVFCLKKKQRFYILFTPNARTI